VLEDQLFSNKKGKGKKRYLYDPNMELNEDNLIETFYDLV